MISENSISFSHSRIYFVSAKTPQLMEFVHGNSASPAFYPPFAFHACLQIESLKEFEHSAVNLSELGRHLAKFAKSCCFENQPSQSCFWDHGGLDLGPRCPHIASDRWPFDYPNCQTDRGCVSTNLPKW